MELVPIIEKLIARKSQKDPITKEARYGPKMIKKIDDVVLERDELVSIVEKLKIQWKNPYEKEIQASMEQIEHEKQRQLQLEQEQVAEKLKLAQEQTLKAENDRKQQEIERLKLETLAKEADLIRQQKKERKETIEPGISNDIEGMKLALQHLEAQATQNEYVDGIQTLQIFIKNICNSPENVLYRQIKVKNTHYHQALGRFKAGEECLYAMGFRLMDRDEDPELAIYFLEVVVTIQHV